MDQPSTPPTRNESSTPRLVDDSHGHDKQRFTLVRIYKIGTDTIRIRITRDFYPHQSAAVAEILTSNRTWTLLIDDPASNWHATHSCTADTATVVLGSIADRLLLRAACILN